MTNKKTIKVQNRAGSDHMYALFNEAPQVQGHVQGQIWSNVFQTAHVPGGAMEAFSVSSQYYAFTGTSRGCPQMGVGVHVSSERPVTLGSMRADGTHIPGNTVQLAAERHAPHFSNNSSPDSAFSGAFAIRSNNDFTAADANNGNYIVGVGGSSNGQSFDGPLASFVPDPSVEYQILPSNTWYLTFGDYRQGSLITKERAGGPFVAIDFNNLPGDVTIVHDYSGRLVLQGC